MVNIMAVVVSNSMLKIMSMIIVSLISMFIRVMCWWDQLSWINMIVKALMLIGSMMSCVMSCMMWTSMMDLTVIC